MKTLRDVKVGGTAIVARLHGEGAVEVTVRNYELSVRKADCEMIEII